MLRMIMAIAMAGLLAAPAAAGAPPASWAPDELLVLLHPGDAGLALKDGRAAAADPVLAALLAKHGLVAGQAVTRRAGSRALKLTAATGALDAPAAARELTASGLVRAASPNYRLGLCVLPDDPMLGTQWHIADAGDADIDLPEAWDIATGDPGVVIAILDTGLDWSHPDLQGATWTNPGEIAGNGLDDDGNGWVDDLHGWDVGNDDADPRPEVYLEQGIDVGFHGTHCAGIAAAATDNGVGVAGAAWGCRLMGLKVNDSDGAITTEGLTAAFDYAVANGAAVISMSFGGALEDFGFMQALVDDAAAAGVVCVAAAGNNNDAVPMYPAALDGVISVGATDGLNQRASFSTYGAWVDVAAPGAQIWSTVQSNYSWDFLTQLLFMLSYGYDGTNPYMYCDGTSMACPLVAGVCGLIKSVRPDYTPAQVLQRLVATGDAVAFDHPLGVKVNARAALDGLVVSAVPAGPAPLRITGVRPNPANPLTRVAYRVPADGAVRLTVHDLRGRLVRVLVDGPVTAGEHAATWDGRDARGRAVASGVYTAVLAGRDGVARQVLTLVK